MKVPCRHYGKSRCHPLQLVVVTIGLLSAFVFYVYSVHELPVFIQRTVISLYSVQLFTTALLFLLISRLDPKLPTDHPSRSADDAPIAITISESDVISPTRPGFLKSRSVMTTGKLRDCGRMALIPGTRHCSRCNKCIPGYDHHCVYLNTCIGARNYPIFVGLLSCSILLLFTQQIVSGYVVLRLLEPGRKDGSKEQAAFLCLLSLLPLLELFFLSILGTFHIYIAYRGLTTHEWLDQWLGRRKLEQTASDTFSRHTSYAL